MKDKHNNSYESSEDNHQSHMPNQGDSSPDQHNLEELLKTVKDLSAKLKNSDDLRETDRRELQREYSQAAHEKINNYKWEKERFENRFLNKVLVPLYKSLKQLVNYMQLHHADKKVLEALNVFTENVVQTLRDANIEEIVVKPYEIFDATRHRSIDSVNTNDKSLVGKVSSMSSEGLVYNKDKVILAAEVITYRFVDSSTV